MRCSGMQGQPYGCIQISSVMLQVPNLTDSPPKRSPTQTIMVIMLGSCYIPSFSNVRLSLGGAAVTEKGYPRLAYS